MRKHRFHIGDRVIITGENSGYYSRYNRGTVVKHCYRWGKLMNYSDIRIDGVNKIMSLYHTDLDLVKCINDRT